MSVKINREAIHGIILAWGILVPPGLKEDPIVAPISIEANRVDHDQSAFLGAVCSVSILFVEEAFKTVQYRYDGLPRSFFSTMMVCSVC